MWLDCNRPTNRKIPPYNDERYANEQSIEARKAIAENGRQRREFY